MFNAPPDRDTEVFAVLPPSLRDVAHESLWAKKRFAAPESGNLAIAHPLRGAVWLFSATPRPRHVFSRRRTA